MNNINEGLKYFKYSPKIEKHLLDAESRLRTVENPETRQGMKDYIDKIRTILSYFKSAEDLFSAGKKKEAKIKYLEAKKKYAYELKAINANSSGKQAFIQVVGYAKYFLIMQLISMGFGKISLLIKDIQKGNQPAPSNNVPVTNDT